jgi:hypothetical protein
MAPPTQTTDFDKGGAGLSIVRLHVATYAPGSRFGAPFVDCLRSMLRILSRREPALTMYRSGKPCETSDAGLAKLADYYTRGFRKPTTFNASLDGPIGYNEFLSRFRILMNGAICPEPLEVHTKRQFVPDPRLAIAHGPPAEPDTTWEPATLNIEMPFHLLAAEDFDALDATLPTVLHRCVVDSGASCGFVDARQGTRAIGWMDRPTDVESACQLEWKDTRKSLNSHIRGISWAFVLAKSHLELIPPISEIAGQLPDWKFTNLDGVDGLSCLVKAPTGLRTFLETRNPKAEALFSRLLPQPNQAAPPTRP